MLNKYLVASVLGLSVINQAHGNLGFIRGSLLVVARTPIAVCKTPFNAQEIYAMEAIQASAKKLEAIREFTPQDIAMLDRLIDQSPARNILWGTFAEEQGESTVGLREENKRNLRLFMSRDVAFDSYCLSSDVHRPIGYSMPAISNPADNENAPTTLERRLKGQVCAKFFKAVHNAKYYNVEKDIKTAELLAQRPNEGEKIFEEVFGTKYQAK